MCNGRPQLSGPGCPHGVGPALWGHDQDCMPVFPGCDQLFFFFSFLFHFLDPHATLAVIYVHNEAMTDSRVGDVTIESALGLDQDVCAPLSNCGPNGQISLKDKINCHNVCLVFAAF